MPARKRRFKLKKNRSYRTRAKGKKNFLLPFFSVVFFVLLTLIYLGFSKKEFWIDDAKLSLAINKPDGSVVITTFDPKLSEITNLYIPANTQVEVARQLGVWKLGSVWELGQSEKLDGELLAATLRYYFKFPVVAWADSDALGFSGSDPGGLLKAVLTSYKSNLTAGDKLSIALFSLRVNNTNRNDVDLANTQFLKKTTLPDGEEGYVVTRKFSQKVLSVFADDELSNGHYKVAIDNATGKQDSAEDVGQIMEVLGVKVASISKSDEEDINCVVSGKESSVITKVARIFSCDTSDIRESVSFDVEIKLGRDFIRNF